MPRSAQVRTVQKQSACDVLVAGAGIIGLSAALELSAQGLSVTVLDRGAPMREASWAAAGMLAAHDPENPRALDALAALSLALYPAFLAQVERLTGLRVPFRTAVTWQGSHAGSSMPPTQPAGLVADLPALRPGARSYSRFAEHSLDPRDLCAALPIAARAAGVKVLENVTVFEVGLRDDLVEIRAGGADFLAQSYLHCCGAWSGLSVSGEALDPPRIPVEPRKGQMVLIAMPEGAPELTCVLRTPELYLVPRGDGRIVVGATVERAGFDRSVDPAATDALLAQAAELWPPIRLGVAVERWSGLRPATPDGLPILDSLGPRAWIASGHFRNGILLAPATARLLAKLVLGLPPELDIAPFRLSRFQPAAIAPHSLPGDKSLRARL